MADIFDLFRQIAKKDPPSVEPVSYLLVGLGNPGAKYQSTRHNAGFLALDFLAKNYGIRVDRARFHSLTGEATVNGRRILFLKPQTMMNASGLAVGEAADFYKIPPERIFVISDEIALPVGCLRVRRKGSAGGHNGLKDIIACIGSEDFPRIRLGIGEKPHPDYDLAAWVLSEFSKKEMQTLDETFLCLKEGFEKMLAGDFDTAMRICNSHRAKDESAT